MLLSRSRSRPWLPSCLRRSSALIVVLFFAGHGRSYAAEATPRLEYQVKAGYLFNFLRFTEWPASALPSSAPYRIGVIGDAATSQVIAESLRDKKVNDRAIEVVWVEAGMSPAGCHLVFIPRTVSFALNEIPPPPILTVGETENYAS